MQYELLGRDEQKPATGIPGIFIDTDFDRAAEIIGNEIWKLSDPNAMFKMAKPSQFLTDLISVLKAKAAMLTDENFQQIQLALLRAYPDRYTRVDLLDEYLNLFIILTRDGRIAESIYDPAYYVPKPDADVAGAITAAGRNVGLLALAGIALYAFFSKGVTTLVSK